MGRPRKTEAQRRADKFAECYRMGKAKTGLIDEQIATVLDISLPTLRHYKKIPDKLAIAKLSTLGKLLCWTEEDFLSIVCPGK